MNLYLSSYMLGNKINILKKLINYSGSKIALIPNALDCEEPNNRNQQINEFLESLNELSFDVKIIDLKKYFGNSIKLIQDLNDFKAVCIMGGNVFVLRKAMELSGFDNFLINNRNNNQMLYLGYSAGICILGKTLSGLDIVCNPINPYNDSPANYTGLGLIDYAIAPHYKSNHKSSELIDKVVEYYDCKKINYKSLKDGEVILGRTQPIKQNNNNERDL